MKVSNTSRFTEALCVSSQGKKILSDSTHGSLNKRNIVEHVEQVDNR